MFSWFQLNVKPECTTLSLAVLTVTNPAGLRSSGNVPSPDTSFEQFLKRTLPLHSRLHFHTHTNVALLSAFAEANSAPGPAACVAWWIQSWCCSEQNHWPAFASSSAGRTSASRRNLSEQKNTENSSEITNTLHKL